jgi:hypothetical protein
MAERDFFRFYNDWLGQQGLVHSALARERFARAFRGLCGRDATTFHRGYEAFLAREGLTDSLAAFARFCALRWRISRLTHQGYEQVALTH